MFQISSTLWMIRRSCGVGVGSDNAGDGASRQTSQLGMMGKVWVSQMEGEGLEGTPATLVKEEKI
jgi:hypothetical protein